MELLEGESLGQRLKAGKLGVGRAVDYGKQIVGLAAAHGSITTRHKPKLLSKAGRVKFWISACQVAAGHEPGAGGGRHQTTPPAVGGEYGPAA